MDFLKDLEKIEAMAEVGINQLLSVKNSCKQIRTKLSKTGKSKIAQNKPDGLESVLVARMNKIRKHAI
jgi:hypothetical protein